VILKLTKIGNSLGIIIPKAILDLLNIDKETLLEIETDGDGLRITPIRVLKGDPNEQR
jgi:antitoxin component of MazEF toxin-antitoxin module